jgi:hypothetical protein
MAEDEPDIASLIRPGEIVRTRDRRDAAITAIDVATGRISGIVPMVGPCHWLNNGRYEAAPGGAAGPLDLMPPREITPATDQRHVSLQGALGDSGVRSPCCD